MLTPERIALTWCFWYRPGLNFIHLVWVGWYALSQQDMSQKQHTSAKILALFRLNFQIKFLSLSNTRWIRSNISSMVRVKMQMSSSYSNKVTNWWSPKHCSIKQQKLEPAFESLNGIWVNSYKPIEPALNAVFFMLLCSIASWRYPWARSKNENQLLLWKACRALSILGNGNASLTVMEFIFCSPHIDEFPQFSFTLLPPGKHMDSVRV